MNHFSVPVEPPGADHPSMTLSCPTAGNRPLDTKVSVGEDRVSRVRQAEDELDDAIRDMKTMAALAEDRGDIETAKEYTRRCLAASRSRTPEHKDRLAREHLAAVEASLDAGVDFFQVEGRRMRHQQEGQVA